MLTAAPIGSNADATGADGAIFKITDANLYVQIVSLSAEDNIKLSELLGEVFKISIYWNKNKVINNKVVEIAAENVEKYIRERLDASCQGVKRLFFRAYDNTAGANQASIDSFKKYFLPRVKIENYNIGIDERNFIISHLMAQLSNTTKSEKYQQNKVMITRLVVYWILLILKNNYRLFAADLSKQKALDADSRAIQQIIFTGKIKSTVADTRVIIFYILKQSK